MAQDEKSSKTGKPGTVFGRLAGLVPGILLCVVLTLVSMGIQSGEERISPLMVSSSTARFRDCRMNCSRRSISRNRTFTWWTARSIPRA